MSRPLREVVFVDGVRTPFGKAGPAGVYAETRADDLVVRLIRELLRDNPALPADRIDEVAIAATTQIRDQGLTIGRTVRRPAGRPRCRRARQRCGGRPPPAGRWRRRRRPGRPTRSAG